MSLRLLALRAGVLAAAIALAAPATAQDTLPPHLGGYVRSLGLPPVHHPYAALAFSYDRRDGQQIGLQARVGIADIVGSPVKNLLGIGAELYAGIRDGAAAGGVRGLVHIPFFGAGAGVDVDPVVERVDPFLTVFSNIRRGGVFGGGSHIRFEWYPTRGHSFGSALTVPLAAPNAGRTRPRRDHVQLRAPAHPPRPYDAFGLLAASLARLDESAQWVNRFSLPPLGRTGKHPEASVAAVVSPLLQRLEGRTVAAEIDAYHREMELAFSIALDACQADCERTPAGIRVATQARHVLLHSVLYPYNRLLGQHKRQDTTREFALHARGSFGRWLVQHMSISADGIEATLHVFQRLLDFTEDARARNRAEYGDSRLVWLPLQLALQPHEYIEKEALDTIVSHAVGRRIRHGNRMWYIYNSRFHQQLVESIARAEDYHVLWIHDFRGMSAPGRPDTLSLLLVTRQYLQSLTERVAAYDVVGRLPVFMLFLDQHYFEVNGSRDLLQLLQDPMHHRLALPGLSPSIADSIARWQDELRQAVLASRLLTVERAEYGGSWLRHLVRVHVSVTNPADPSFRSTFGRRPVSVPDDIMRDHRKAVVYDVSEEDPFRGLSMYAGMGVGEHYASPAWEDRALMLQGPAALTLRDAARRLLEDHGLRESQVPHVLRPRPWAPDYEERIAMEIDSMDAKGEVAVRAIELHNTTGFGPKEIAVAQATLFNLISPGGVMKIPDSLWMNELFASLLAGGALRGARVLPIAPSRLSAPAPALGLIAVHDVFSRLLAFSRVMAPQLAAAGGTLRPGIYHSRGDVDDVAARTLALARSMQQYPFLAELYPTLPAFFAAHAASLPVPAGEPAGSSAAAAAVADLPAKLHLKGFLYISMPAWAHLIAGPPLERALQVYLTERQRLSAGETNEDAMVRTLQRIGAEVINPVLEALPGGHRSDWVFYLQLGSPNMDYRSMLLDGEVAALISDWTSLYAFFDFMLLVGQVEWVEDQAALDALIPPPGAVGRRLGRWIRFAL
jgi:hypothetical protein